MKDIIAHLGIWFHATWVYVRAKHHASGYKYLLFNGVVRLFLKCTTYQCETLPVDRQTILCVARQECHVEPHTSVKSQYQHNNQCNGKLMVVKIVNGGCHDNFMAKQNNQGPCPTAIRATILAAFRITAALAFQSFTHFITAAAVSTSAVTVADPRCFSPFAAPTSLHLLVDSRITR